MLVKGEADRAISDLDRALKITPEDPHALVVRGMALTTKREYVRALVDLDKAISLDGSKIEIYAARAAVHEAQGKGELALADLRKAMEITPKNFMEIVAQANIKKRIDDLTKRNPCGSAGRGTGGDTCL